MHVYAPLAVDVFSAANTHNQYAQLLVEQFADDAVLSDPITPEFSERTTQSLAETANVLHRSDPLIHVVENSTRRLFV